MDGSVFGPEPAHSQAFQPGPAMRRDLGGDPGPAAEAGAEREWGLTPGQVVGAVLAIIALCELVAAVW